MGKAHYIEVYSESDNNDGEELVKNRHKDRYIREMRETSNAEGKVSIVTSVSRFSRYHTFRVKGVLARHKVTVLIDGGLLTTSLM